MYSLQKCSTKIMEDHENPWVDYFGGKKKKIIYTSWRANLGGPRAFGGWSAFVNCNAESPPP